MKALLLITDHVSSGGATAIWEKWIETCWGGGGGAALYGADEDI